MKNFIGRARAIFDHNYANDRENCIDTDVVVWASRAFATVGFAGEMDIPDDVAEELAQLLAKAPPEVLIGGGAFMRSVVGDVNDMMNMERAVENVRDISDLGFD